MKPKRKAPACSIKKGECRNPLGINNRAKLSQNQMISHFLAKLANGTLEKVLKPGTLTTMAEDTARAAFNHAQVGNAKYLEIVLDRTEGRLKDQLEISGGVSVDYASLISAARKTQG